MSHSHWLVGSRSEERRGREEGEVEKRERRGREEGEKRERRGREEGGREVEEKR